MKGCKAFLICACVFAVLATARIATADSVTIGAIDSGWYNPGTGHNAFNKNYQVGDASDLLGPYRDYFSFSLAGVTNTITSASLRVYSIFVSQDNIVVTLHAVGETAAQVGATQVSEPVYGQLGSGVEYGSRVYNTSDDRSFQTFTLNATALAALNAAKGSGFVIGGTADNNHGAFVYGFSGGGVMGYDVQLLLQTQFIAVPLPSTAALGTILLGSLAGLQGARGRRAVCLN